MENNEKLNINPLFEWAVWGHLESERNLELILLKGHLLLEFTLESFLRHNKIDDCEDYSFYRKISCFENFDITDKPKQTFIINSLKVINILRNKLAHEFLFDLTSGELENWSSEILNNLQGMKWSKYTTRTRIVHSFSILSRNILDLKNE
jgi:hypothetical protein